jgi:ribonuclease Z
MTLVGPEGLQDFLDALPLHSPKKPASFPLKCIELNEHLACRLVFESEHCRVEARPIQHGVQAVGYRFEEKDRPGNLDVNRAMALGVHDHEAYRRLKAGTAVTLPNGRVVEPAEVVGPIHRGGVFAYVTDTRPTSASVKLARKADLLYHEATFLDDDRERALKTHHSTAREAAAIASEAGVGRLIIGHFSARYHDANSLIGEAREVFQNTDAAQELKRYFLPGDAPTVALDSG